MSATPSRRDSWSRYWAGGALHSCAGSFAGDYDDAIGAWWRGCFAALAPGARVLDLATGNGALPRLLIATRPAADVEIDAVDLADVRPAWIASLAPAWQGRVRIAGGVAAEMLPFADASFELVVSQYGLEYTDLARSCAELQRVARPAGRIALLLHHRESLPVRLGIAETTHCDWLLASGGLLDRARRLLPFLARLATPAGVASVQRDPQAAKARERLNEAMRSLEARAATAPAPDLLYETQAAIGQLLGSTAQIGERAARDRLEAIADGLQQARLRQAELGAHALDRAGVDALAERLGAPPRTATVGEVRVRGELFGWTLDLAPASA